MTGRARAALALGAVLMAGTIAACSGEDSDRRGLGFGSGGERDSADGLVVIARTPYEVVPQLGATGSVRGRVGLSGASPGDSSYTVPAALRACGGEVTVSPAQGDSAGLAEVVVWLEEVRRGKAPTEERRTGIAHEDCQVRPRVQAVIAGTTVNIGNSNPVAHTARFANYGATHPLLSIPFTARGQVVPSETLARESGIIEASSAELPWARAWIAVFDHPYFAVTANDGAFTLDSVLPGRYTLKAWHPRGTEVVSRPVEVGAGGAASVEVFVPVR